MTIIDTAKQYIFGIGLRKAVQRGAQAVVSLIAAQAAAPAASGYGVSMSGDALTICLTPAIMGLLELARNYIKVKLPKVGAWL